VTGSKVPGYTPTRSLVIFASVWFEASVAGPRGV
jgi:hypothetical protein